MAGSVTIWDKCLVLISRPQKKILVFRDFDSSTAYGDMNIMIPQVVDSTLSVMLIRCLVGYWMDHSVLWNEIRKQIIGTSELGLRLWNIKIHITKIELFGRWKLNKIIPTISTVNSINTYIYKKGMVFFSTENLQINSRMPLSKCEATYDGKVVNPRQRASLKKHKAWNYVCFHLSSNITVRLLYIKIHVNPLTRLISWRTDLEYNPDAW